MIRHVICEADYRLEKFIFTEHSGFIYHSRSYEVRAVFNAYQFWYHDWYLTAKTESIYADDNRVMKIYFCSQKDYDSYLMGPTVSRCEDVNWPNLYFHSLFTLILHLHVLWGKSDLLYARM